jgi:metallo-beta-lactamase family protein
MKIKFCGGAQTVTGSQHLFEINGKKLLLECGLFQGRREESYRINKHFIFNPAEIDTVILSHAHIDHSGNLPALSAGGFTGDIYATTATRDLCSIMLQDSANIQVKDTEYINKKRKKRNEPLFNPLYNLDDVRNVMKLFKAISYRQPFHLEGLDEKVQVTFFEAGHILGSAQILLEINENGRNFKLGFTGDLGRPHLPILKDPEFIGNVNYLITESTYGGRVHAKVEDMDKQLQAAINESAARGGRIIVPAFSVGRTQELIYSLSKLFDLKAIPKIPIFIDSPLSVNVSDVFKMHTDCFDKETSDLIAQGIDVFGFDNLTYIRSVEESKRLNEFKECCMIISASGMCEGGRVLHHLKNNIEDENSTVLIIGFMAVNTLGRRLVEAKDIPNSKVRIFGDEYTVKCKIHVLNSFSAHADKNELMEYFSKFDKNLLENIFLVHGDPDQQEIFKQTLIASGFKNVEIPGKDSEYNV